MTNKDVKCIVCSEYCHFCIQQHRLFLCSFCWSTIMTRYAMLDNIRPSVVCLVVISQKLRKKGPQLLSSTIRKADRRKMLKQTKRHEITICLQTNTRVMRLKLLGQSFEPIQKKRERSRRSKSFS